VADSASQEERLHRALFSAQGIVDSLVGPIVFLVLYRTIGLDAALIGAGAVALGFVAMRTVRGQETTTAWYGVGGVAIGAALAKATGSSDGFFLPKIAINAVYGSVLVASVVIGKPLVGIGWAFFHRQPIEWGYRPEVRRVFSALTLMWAGAHVVRILAYAVLIADDKDRTGSLAAVSVGLGLPLTAAMVGITILVARRKLGPLARPAEPAGPQPDDETGREPDPVPPPLPVP